MRDERGRRVLYRLLGGLYLACAAALLGGAAANGGASWPVYFMGAIWAFSGCCLYAAAHENYRKNLALARVGEVRR